MERRQSFKFRESANIMGMKVRTKRTAQLVVSFTDDFLPAARTRLELIRSSPSSISESGVCFPIVTSHIGVRGLLFVKFGSAKWTIRFKERL
jgi:hypothetical protein